MEANSLYLTDGTTPLLIISCDLVGLELAVVKPIREAIASATGIPPRQILITCTHTHSGPSLIRTNYHIPVDVAYIKQLQPQDEPREVKLKRIGRMLADETLRLYRQAEFHASVVLGHAHKDLKIDVRLPDPKRLQEAKEVLQKVDAGENIGGMKLILAFGVVLLQEQFGEQPTDTVPIHVIRIGDIALITQPCELYAQFGLDIKRRSPTPLTAVVGLADGYCGYCPTIAGILGGGYSGEPINWTRLETLAGYRIVEAAGPMLNRLWRTQTK